jgi:predicted transcriptional regulator
MFVMSGWVISSMTIGGLSAGLLQVHTPSEATRIDSLHAATSARLSVIGRDATLQAAAAALSQPGIGLIVVCSGPSAAGVVTKSDLIRHLAAEGAADASVARLMRRSIIACAPDDELYDVWQTMTAQNLQNVPVLGVGRKPIGILDVRDAMQALLEQEQRQEHALIDYIAGIGYR